MCNSYLHRARFLHITYGFLYISTFDFAWWGHPLEVPVIGRIIKNAIHINIYISIHVNIDIGIHINFQMSYMT